MYAISSPAIASAFVFPAATNADINMSSMSASAYTESFICLFKEFSCFWAYRAGYSSAVFTDHITLVVNFVFHNRIPLRLFLL